MPQLDAALDVGRQDLFHDIAGPAEMLAGQPHRRDLRGMALAAGHFRHDRDPDRPRRRGAAHRHVVPSPVAPIAPRHDFEGQACIAHGAGVRALGRHQDRTDRAAGGGPGRIEGGNTGKPGAQADHAVAVSGDAHRAANIVAVGDRADAGCRCGPRAAARATGRHAGIARIERAAVQGIVGEDAHREGGRIGTAHDDRAGMLQVGDDGTVFLRDQVLQRNDAVVGWQAGLVDVDLGCDGNAVQRRQGVAARAGGVGRLGLGAGFALQHAHDGVDRGIDLVQAGEDGIDRFPRRGLPGADQARQVGRVVLPKLHFTLAQRCFVSVPKKIMLPSASAMAKSRSP